MTPAQKLHMDMLRLTAFNDLDGEEVANLLMEHSHLWDGFIFGNAEYFPLGPLRDIDSPNGPWADQLWLKTTSDRVDDLVKLLQRGKATEIGWIDRDKQKWNGVAASQSLNEFKDLNSAFLGGFYNQSNSITVIRAFWD